MGYKRDGTVGIGGVLSEIGLLAHDRNDLKVPRTELIKGLCERFEVTEHQAMVAIQNTINAHLAIVRDNDQIAFLDPCRTENPREVCHKRSLGATGVICSPGHDYCYECGWVDDADKFETPSGRRCPNPNCPHPDFPDG